MQPPRGVAALRLIINILRAFYFRAVCCIACYGLSLLCCFLLSLVFDFAVTAAFFSPVAASFSPVAFFSLLAPVFFSPTPATFVFLVSSAFLLPVVSVLLFTSYFITPFFFITLTWNVSAAVSATVSAFMVFFFCPSALSWCFVPCCAFLSSAGAYHGESLPCHLSFLSWWWYCCSILDVYRSCCDWCCNHPTDSKPR